MSRKEGYHVIYITGSPATGKSSLVENIVDTLSPVLAFSYNAVLADYIGQKLSGSLSHDDIRRQSARIVSPADVLAVDKMLLDFVHRNRATSHLLIDSHAVTKEDFGYRVTPFSVEMLHAIAPTMIVMLYCEDNIVLDRIKANDGGRRRITEFEAGFHRNLQASVALTYSVLMGVPTFCLDSNQPKERLTQYIASFVSK